MDSLAGKRLVIFGCGYLGAAVAREAIARGLRVVALTRSVASATVLREQGIETVVADLATEAWHDQIEGNPELALNCVSSGGGELEAYRHSYLEGMASLLAWARRKGGAGTMAYTSSTSVYPQGGGATVDEAAATGGTDRATILLGAEALLRSATKECARWFILRLAGIYGPDRHHLIDQIRRGAVSGRGEHRLNLVHRDDAVAAIWACFTAPPEVRNEVFNVADDNAAPKQDVAAWVAGELGLASPQFTGEAISPRRGVTPDRVIANAKLRARLGWRPRYPSFQEGFANFLSR